MKKTKTPSRMLVFALLTTLALAGHQAAAQEQSTPKPFDPAEEQGIRELVRDYLLAHPEVLIEALKIYQKREQVATEERQRQALETRRADLESDIDSPVLGNPDGDVALVEFFDYRCPYCKKVAQDTRDVVKADGKVRLIMKEFPILGAESQFAARAALASVNQGRYEEFHFAMMSAPGRITKDSVRAIAAHIGLDVARLERDMQSDRIDAMLRKNFELAEALGVKGTPAFVIGDELVPGAVGKDELKSMISKTRAGSS